MICVDIRHSTTNLIKYSVQESHWYHFNMNGLKDGIEVEERDSDFILYAYSKKADQMQFYKYIGVNFQDLYYVAELHIEKLYDLAKYLGKLKKKDFKDVL